MPLTYPANGRQRNTLLWAIVFVMISSASACTSLKRFAYDGYKRDEWQQPDRVVASLQLNIGDKVADLGSGGGYFTFRLADAVGASGMVYAVDVDQSLLDYVNKTAAEKGYENIETIRATNDDARLAAKSLDLIFVCNTYHHLQDRQRYFRDLKHALNDTGRGVVIDFTSGWLNSIGHGTETEEIVNELQQAGYELQAQFDFLDKQNFLIFTTND